MAGTVWFDKERVLAAVRTGLHDGLEEAGERVAAEAKRRAPIRKVFRENAGYRRKFRALTQAESSLAMKRANDFYTRVRPDNFARRRAVAHVRYYARVQLPRRGSANAPATSRTMRLLGFEKGGRFASASGSMPNSRGGFEPSETLGKALTSRGRFEVKSGRAIHREPSEQGTQTRVQIGGALKASIGSEGVTQAPKGLKVRVSAAIRYAKFVEFPTIRTSAQPFLLPALHGERGRLTRSIAAAIKKNLGG